MTDQELTLGKTDAITKFVPGHEALPYLVEVPNLEPDQLSLVIDVANRTSDQDVAETFHHVHQLVSIAADPDQYPSDVQKLQAGMLRNYDKTQQHFAELGLTRDTITQDDIEMGGINLEYSRLSREEYVNWLEAEAQADIARHDEEPKTGLIEKIEQLKEALSSEELESFLRLLRININEDGSVALDILEEQYAMHLMFTRLVGQRIDPGYREFITHNPSFNSTLATLMSQNSIELLDTEAVMQLVEDNEERRLRRNRIKDGDVERSELRQVTLEVNADDQIEPFIKRRLAQLIEEDEIPYDEIATMLRFLEM